MNLIQSLAIKILKRDKYVNYYHVITEKSKNELQKITSKPIFVSEFWLNQKLFFKLKIEVNYEKNTI